MLSHDLIERAARFLGDRVRRTPVERSEALSERLGTDVWLKLENLQLTGSFKVRGAWFACAELADADVRHVATCSAGNHGKGLALAARKLGLQATVFVPSSIDPSKRASIESLGAEVVVSRFGGYDETERWALEEIDRRGLTFLSAYDDERIMAGNGGSIALEIAEQAPHAHTFVLPVGGEGLSAGFCFALSKRNADAEYALCQHEESPALAMSIDRGEAVTEWPGIQTIASGLEGGMGARPFDVLRHVGPEVVLVSESELRQAVVWMMEQHGYVIEGSAAAGIAAVLSGKLQATKGDVVIVVTGRNIGREALWAVLDAGAS